MGQVNITSLERTRSGKLYSLLIHILLCCIGADDQAETFHPLDDHFCVCADRLVRLNRPTARLRCAQCPCSRCPRSSLCAAHRRSPPARGHRPRAGARIARMARVIQNPEIASVPNVTSATNHSETVTADWPGWNSNNEPTPSHQQADDQQRVCNVGLRQKVVQSLGYIYSGLVLTSKLRTQRLLNLARSCGHSIRRARQALAPVKGFALPPAAASCRTYFHPLLAR